MKMTENKDKKENIFKLQYRQFITGNKPYFVFWFFPIFIIILFLFPFIVTRSSCMHLFDYSETGQIGDTIGGLTAPIIAILVAILTFFAFWVQVKANISQKEQFNKQDNDLKIERFENKFFEFVRFHRSNMEEMNIEDKFRGRLVFVELYKELRYCFYFIKHCINELPAGTNQNDLGFDLNDDENIIKIAYLIFNHGNGDESERLMIEPVRKLCSTYFIEILKAKIKDNQKYFEEHKDKYGMCVLVLDFGSDDKYNYSANYKPFNGHITRLGHYFRHLYQTVKYVSEFNKVDFTEKNRYDYLKILRAQLSSYEQILLYYNSLSYLGMKWLDPDHPYLITYKLIKNLPLPLADFGIKPETKFHDIIEKLKLKQDYLFEWQENLN